MLVTNATATAINGYRTERDFSIDGEPHATDGALISTDGAGLFTNQALLSSNGTHHTPYRQNVTFYRRIRSDYEYMSKGV